MDQVTLSISIDTPDVRVLLRALADALGTQVCTQSVKAETMQSEVLADASETTPTVNSDEIMQDYERKLAEAEAKISELRKEKEDSERKLGAQIEDLKKQLYKYKPIGVGNGENVSYFDVKNGQLVLTNDDKAPYQANIISSDKASYQFNDEKGPCKEACRDKERMIKPFCEIEDDKDGATEIHISEWGEATYDAIRCQITKIVKKAKVKLI